MFGSLESAEGISKDLAVETGMVVVSVGYRLSPEVKFPVPILVSNVLFLFFVFFVFCYCMGPWFRDMQARNSAFIRFRS